MNHSQALTPVTAGLPSPDELQVAKTMAEAVAKTAFASGWQQSPVAVLAAMLYGREIGLGPVNSVLNINVIQGRPAPSAELTLALIRSRGHSVQVLERSDTKLVVKGTRKDNGDSDTVTWSWDRASKILQNGRPLTSKENWRNYPQQMLFARAVTELATTLFSDVALGLMTPEELGSDMLAPQAAGERNGSAVDMEPTPVSISPEAEPAMTPPPAPDKPRRGRPKGSRLVNGKLVMPEDLAPEPPENGSEPENRASEKPQEARNDDPGSPSAQGITDAPEASALPSYMQGEAIGPEVAGLEPMTAQEAEATIAADPQPIVRNPLTAEEAAAQSFTVEEQLDASLEAVDTEDAEGQIWRYAKLIKQAQVNRQHVQMDWDSLELNEQAQKSLDKFAQDRWSIDYGETSKPQKLVILAQLLALHRQISG